MLVVVSVDFVNFCSSFTVLSNIDIIVMLVNSEQLFLTRDTTTFSNDFMISRDLSVILVIRGSLLRTIHDRE